MSGQVERVRDANRYFAHLDLDNGVSVSVSFNDEEIHVHFSGIVPKAEGHFLDIREAKLLGNPIQLPNQLTVQYKSRTKL